MSKINDVKKVIATFPRRTRDPFELDRLLRFLDEERTTENTDTPEFDLHQSDKIGPAERKLSSSGRLVRR